MPCRYFVFYEFLSCSLIVGDIARAAYRSCLLATSIYRPFWLSRAAIHRLFPGVHAYKSHIRLDHFYSHVQSAFKTHGIQVLTPSTRPSDLL